MLRLFKKTKPRPAVHFVGIGGCGMNGVARLAAHSGLSVTGSDREQDLPVFETLEEAGIRLFPQDGSGITEQTNLVVYSTAVEKENPDLVCARQLGIPLLHRAEMLARLCHGKELIAVAGTAGKSTVTGLLGWIFEQLGKDPTVYCGAKINNFNSSVRFGNGPWIIEADESDRSFLNFEPDHAIITNIAEDHFALEELHQLFDAFRKQVKGTVIERPDSFKVPSPLLGKHNIENINHSLTLSKALGLPLEPCIKAVAGFRGIERRLERIGPHVIDDFAHSPIKIEAALEAVSEEFDRFAAYWRPHGYTPLFEGLNNFIKLFAAHWEKRPNDKLFILPVYYAGGTVNRKIISAQFVDQLNRAGVPAEYAENYDELERRLIAAGLPVLGMGARDPELGPFARKIAQSASQKPPSPL